MIVAAAASAVWPVDKPAGPTSHDVVARVRRGLPRGVKVGHAGTLDPFATGLLLVLVGRATRLARYLSGLDKAYLADVALGTVSPTGDPEGPLTRTGEAPPRERIEAALPGFLGAQRQRVPAYAAVKVDGERLYRRARRGEAVEAPERDVVIHRIELVDHDAERGVVRLLVECSKGTYLRQLAVDLGGRLGCGAHCAALRRLRVGPIDLEGAVAPEDVGAEGGLDPLRALAHLPRRELAPEEVRLVAHGRPVPAGDALAPGPVALAAAGRLVAVAEGGEGDALRPSVVLVTPEEARDAGRASRADEGQSGEEASA